MDTVRSGPTPYRSCSVAESISLPMTALPTTGNPPSAAGTIGNYGRFSVSRNRLRVGFKGSGVRKGHRLRGRRGGIDWNRARQQAGRGQHHGIDWDRLGRSATYRKHPGIDEGRLPGPVTRRPRDGIGQDCLGATAPRRPRVVPDRTCLGAFPSHRPPTGVGGGRPCGPVPRRSRADIYGDCPRGSTVGRSQGRASGGWGRGRGEGAP
jgi:hypothetical protein